MRAILFGGGLSLLISLLGTRYAIRFFTRQGFGQPILRAASVRTARHSALTCAISPRSSGLFHESAASSSQTF